MMLNNRPWRVCAALALLGLAGLATSASAQCADYEINQTSGASIVPGTTDIGLHTDDGLLAITLPFTVNFYGVDYTTASVSSNGNLQLGTPSGTFTNSYINECLPTTNGYITGPMICPFWDDLYTSDAAGGQGIFSAVNGAAPNRTFILEWRTQYCCSGGAPVNNFEVIFYEGSAGFDIIYGSVADRASATIGVTAGTSSGHNAQFSCNTSQSLAGTLLHFDCGSGACCLVDGTCSVVSRGVCAANGGLYGGDNTTCGANCQRPGACCMTDGTCHLTSAALCASAGGTYGGDGVTCGQANCAPGGSCCLPSGSCAVLTASVCAAQNGIWGGSGSTCTGVSCTGRCCSPDGTCQVTSQQNCSAISGAVYSSGVLSCSGTYQMTQGTTALEDISSTGTLLFGNGTNPTTGQLDDGSSTVTLPFNFSFFGNPKTVMQVGTNGYITFSSNPGDGTYYSNTGGIPNPTLPNDIIAAPWDDFYLYTSGQVNYQVNGVAPNQKLIVQWTNVPYYGNAAGGQSTFQVILFEGSNNIEIRIGSIADAEPTTDPTKVLGLENSDGTVAVAVPWPGNSAANGTSYSFVYQSECGGSNPVCCLQDYNGDGDSGTDADIETFFSCLAGNCCATCPPDADFNCDGDVGTDADIESFFRVLGGGNC